MKRRQLEHILRAAAGITGADRFVVIGSQAILGQFADPPPKLLVSIEADLFSLRNPEDAELIDGSIGEASPFHQAFGYYAHGVGESTVVLPDGWKKTPHSVFDNCDRRSRRPLREICDTRLQRVSGTP